MRRPRRRPAQELRRAIDCMPETTRRAMLEAMGDETLIVGAYTDRHGGVCPMLAAHRHGGRTSLSSFARAWDRYTGARSRPRRATERELLVLRSMLEASLAASGASELAAAAEQHRAALRARFEREAAAPEPAGPAATAAPRPGERDRTGELRHRPGWAWLRVFRRHDEYQAALAELEAAEGAERGAPAAPERELTGPRG